MNTPFKTIAEVKAANIAIGNHFFDVDTMKFFKSLIKGDLINGRYFITSEQQKGHERKYTIRMVNNNGTIETLYKFQSFKTASEAAKAIKNLPAQFYEAYECARTQWTAEKHTPISGMKFTDFAAVEPANNRDKSYSTDSFTGACSYLVCNYQDLDVSFVAHLINGNDLLTEINYSANFSS